MSLPDHITSPAALRTLDSAQLAKLAAAIRAELVEKVAKRGGHLGPNLGVVELTIALHRVFSSPHDPIVFDTGHQSYVHKMLTGRAAEFDQLRQRGGLSGYPCRAESEHDWVENSHASTALAYADGLAKAFDISGQHTRVPVAVLGDGALTGGMCWEALNNIAAGTNRPVVIVFNDNGRSYAPTAGGIAQRLAAIRLKPSYERMLSGVKTTLPRAPLVGRPMYALLHALKTAAKDWLVPQTLFADLGLKYVGPIDGHDMTALEVAFTRARAFGGPVLVHCITRKGHGYGPAEADLAELMHSPSAFDPDTGRPLAAGVTTYAELLGRELVRHAANRPDLVAITAAMPGPTGLSPFAATYPERYFDVGIAEQHALTSAAGLAFGGMHPVVALYATFLNRAFDQLLMDVALHRLPVTVVLDRAGITGEDGPSHHGMWDLSMAALIPGLQVAAPRDETTFVAELSEALDVDNGPTLVRYAKGAVPDPIPAMRTVNGLDVLAEYGVAPQVLIVAIGAMASAALDAAATLADSGIDARVVDPRWVLPIPAALIDLARAAEHVVCVEDGGRASGVGALLRDALGDRAVQVCAIPQQFCEGGLREELLAEYGLSGQQLAAGIRKAYLQRPAAGTEPG